MDRTTGRLPTSGLPTSWGPSDWACAYLVAQGLAGGAWWIAVYRSDTVRRLTLGPWNPDLLVAPDVALFVLGSLIAAATARWRAAAVVSLWSVAVTVALFATALRTRDAGWGVALMVVASLGTIGATNLLRNGTFPTALFFVGPFRFRPAPERSGRRHLVRSLVQLVVFWALLLGVAPFVASTIEHRIRLDTDLLDAPALTWIGWALFVACSALGIASCITLSTRGNGTPLPAETARDLVTEGPYGRVRNPMAVAGVGQTIGVGFVLGSWVVIAAALVGAAFWNIVIRPEEEKDMIERFGATFLRYSQRVGCWWPGNVGVTPRAR